MNGYDVIAPFYDLVVKIIFGKKIKELQICHFKQIKNNSKVLILGGGTGWILEEIDIQKSGLTITYIDLSSNMISKSKKRHLLNNNILFIQGTQENIPDVGYDVLITNFYLDLFPEKELVRIVKNLSKFNFSLWIWTDFVPNKSYKWLEKVMIMFFKIITGLKNNKVYQYQEIIEKNTNYSIISKKTEMKGFIVSGLMQLKIRP